MLRRSARRFPGERLFSRRYAVHFLERETGFFNLRFRDRESTSFIYFRSSSGSGFTGVPTGCSWYRYRESQVKLRLAYVFEMAADESSAEYEDLPGALLAHLATLNQHFTKALAGWFTSSFEVASDGAED